MSAAEKSGVEQVMPASSAGDFALRRNRRQLVAVQMQHACLPCHVLCQLTRYRTLFAHAEWTP
jgi:hypothetical protein